MKKRVFVVDDSAILRKATRYFLESQPNVEVCGEAADGTEVLEKVTQLDPDLIILDFQMPRMNGLQAARQLRASHIWTPIILFTFYSEAVRLQEAIAAGVNAVVAKSRLDELQKQVENLL